VGRLVVVALLSVAVAHCGGSIDKGAGGDGTGSDGGSGGTPDAGTDLGACGAGESCPSGSTCYFLIGSCSSEGRCIENSTGPECGAIQELCGCNGELVTTGCGYPSGYASGPATGNALCGPAPEPTNDAGFEDAGFEDAGFDDAGFDDAGFDDGGFREDGGSGDASFFDGGTDGDTDGGLDLGPCGNGGICQEGSTCYYPLNSCSAVGECFTNGSGPACGAVETLCGCNGGQVYTGCGYPPGFASAPNVGQCPP